MIIKKTFPTLDAWVEYRHKSVGGSDVGTILGFNKYCTPFAWKANRGAPPVENEAMHMGHLLEPVVAQLFKEQTSCEYDEGCSENEIWENDKFPNFHATPDRVGTTLDGRRFVLEIKTTSLFVDKTKIPEGWYLQLQLYLLICEIERGYLAWLSQGRYFDFVEIERNPDICEKIVKQVLDFLKDTDAAAPSFADAAAVYPVADLGKIKECDADTFLLVQRILDLQKKQKEIENQIDDAKAKILLFAKESEELTYQGLKVATLKNVKPRKVFDAKAFAAAKPDEYAAYCKEGKGYRQLRFFNND